MMSQIWLCVFVLLAKPYPIYGGLGSVVSPSCPIKCDVFVEVQAIRQMVNQESLIRMGIDAQTQELRKTVSDVITKLQQINSSLESTASSQQTSLEIGISTVTNRLEELNRSVLDTDIRIGQVNSSMKRALARVKRDVQTLKQTSNQMQGIQLGIWNIYHGNLASIL